MNYSTIKAFNLALTNYGNALEIAEKCDSDPLLANIYDNMRLCYSLMNMADSASFYGIKSLEAYKKLLESSPNNSDYHTGIGKAFFELNDLEQANIYFRKAISINAAKGLKTKSLSTHIYLGDSFFRSNQLDSAKHHYLEASTILNIASPIVLKKLSEVESKKGKFFEAYTLLSEYLEAEELVRGPFVREEVLQMEQVYKVLESEKNLLVAQNENIKNKNSIYFLQLYLILAFSLMVLVGFLFYQKKRNEKRLIEINQKITTQADALKKANDEISFMNQNLDDLVKNRTETIKEQNIKIREFIFMNAHEIRGPVSTLLGLINHIEEEGIMDGHDDIQGYLRDVAIRIDQIIRDVQARLDEDNIG